MPTSASAIRTPDQRLRVFISSTLGELAPERDAVDAAVASLRLIPVRFELGARPHRPDDLYRAYLDQSDIFVGIYWQSYGWVAPAAEISGIEDELLRCHDKPRLIYVKEPAPEREDGLVRLLDQIRDGGLATYRNFGSSGELAELVVDDLALLVSERFFEGSAPQELPAGTVSFLFVDIDGSTALAGALGETYAEVLTGFRSVVRDAVERGGGTVVDTEDDGAFCVFTTVEAAAVAAVDVQRRLADREWPDGVTVRARMGIHTGVASRTAAGYTGLEVHRAARIGAAANGGQILVSRPAVELLQQPRLEGGSVIDLGAYALKGLDRAERLFQLVAPGLAESRPAPRARGERVVQLPEQLTELVGRTEEIDAAAELIVRHDVRLVTLTGPGGIGKSRLAVAVATRVADNYPDGVYFVALADTRTTEQVESTIAATLGVGREGAEPLLDTVRGRLAASRALLVLDNFEQVTEARTLVADMLGGCPGMDVLVTSRTPLRLRGEHERPVPPLPVQTDAVRLFLDRAHAARPGWEPAEDDLAHVAEICRRLDGLPLAIELAAARLRVLDPQALLERLDRKLDVVGGSLPDLPDRQRTLTSTIEWSVELLADEERALLGRLGLFARGWSLEAAEAVCQDDVVPDVLTSLERLVEHSLVTTEVGASGRRRMRMLETIAEFARARLAESGELEKLRSRQANYFDAFVAALHVRAGAEIAREAMLGLDDEWDDFVAVMLWRDARGEHAEIVETTSATWRYVWLRARVRDAEGWLRNAFLARAELEPGLRGEVSRLWGAVCLQTGRFEDAKAAVEEAVELLAEWGTPDREAWARMLFAGILSYYDPDPNRPLAEMMRATDVFTAEQSVFGAAMSRGWSGAMLSSIGRADLAAPQFDEAIALSRAFGIPAMVGGTTTLRAFGFLATGDLAAARAALEEASSSPLYQESSALWLETFAAVALADGDLDRAAIAEGAASSFRERTGIQRWPFLRPILEPRLAALDDGGLDVEPSRFAGRQMAPEVAMARVLGRPLASAMPPG